MAEERNLATARAPEAATEAAGAEPTKEELQRRMEEARESITQTVNDIKETVTTKYEDVRETISQTLDWREQFRRRPLALSAGALGAGVILGYTVGGALYGGGGGEDLAERYYGAEGEYDESRAEVSGSRGRSYAAQAITGGAYGSTAYASQPPSVDAARQAFDSGMERQESQGSRASLKEDYDDASRSSDGVPSAPRPSYSSGYESATAATPAASDEPDKPSLVARFKETQAYDRLQDEVSKLGARAVEELSKTAQNVVLPALLNKLKDMVGIDLSTQREVASRSRLEQQSATAQSATDRAAGGSSQGASAGTGSQTGAQGSGTGGYGKSL